MPKRHPNGRFKIEIGARERNYLVAFDAAIHADEIGPMLVGLLEISVDDLKTQIRSRSHLGVRYKSPEMASLLQHAMPPTGASG